ncbi:hypothetical protein [Domibacillus epiphyticus]|uniref:Uncharacterized protein n=1 Tax=Domibacillus epiphyticus TaxID=1714355 RepID=A0A1V2A9R6_9BACI|nr:hypothetical protein [Domibacillus epiphyticus]OMP67582.1 hypothetical protein BTO28_06460 [Domibacillus epiphyticus]
MLKGLLKKDFWLIKTYMLVWLCAVVVIYAAGAGFASYHDQFHLVFPFLMMLYMGHIVMLPTAAWILLKAEEKGQYWLHGTAGGKKLLLSKMMISFFVTMTSLFVTNVLMLISLMISVPLPYFPLMENGSFPFFEGVLLNGGITLGAFYFTLWGLFLWAFYHSLTKYPVLKKIRWVIIIAMYLIIQTVIARITEWKMVQSFFNQWTIQVGLPESKFETYNAMSFSFTMTGGEIQVWPIVLGAIYLLILFLAAGWLLDRKVEV